jgi:hypothetical protein
MKWHTPTAVGSGINGPKLILKRYALDSIPYAHRKTNDPNALLYLSPSWAMPFPTAAAPLTGETRSDAPSAKQKIRTMQNDPRTEANRMREFSPVGKTWRSQATVWRGRWFPQDSGEQFVDPRILNHTPKVEILSGEYQVSHPIPERGTGCGQAWFGWRRWWEFMA